MDGLHTFLIYEQVGFRLKGRYKACGNCLSSLLENHFPYSYKHKLHVSACMGWDRENVYQWFVDIDLCLANPMPDNCIQCLQTQLLLYLTLSVLKDRKDVLNKRPALISLRSFAVA